MIQGSIVALVTPMTESGDIDYATLGDLIAWHIASGTQALVSVGTTGESATLDTTEHCAVLEFTVRQVAGRIPVIAGTGANATREAIHLTQQAQEIGADACLLVTPYYNKPTQEGLYQHYKAIAAAVAIPQILYNVPGRTAVDLLPATVARLAGLPNITGIKEAAGDVQRIIDLRQQLGADFAIYTGDDATACEAILRGADGDISVTANVAPVQMQAMCIAALAGDSERARALDAELAGLHQNLFIESNPIPVKWALARMGRLSSGIRLPLTPLSAVAQPAVTAALHQASII
jgi:4-hydroxy-tetrahydrodipicolinate synthase